MFTQFEVLGLNAPEFLILAVVVLVLFGGRQLLELAIGLIESTHGLLKGMHGDENKKN
jgi:Sec-independent protein translocase protein TatA